MTGRAELPSSARRPDLARASARDLTGLLVVLFVTLGLLAATMGATYAWARNIGLAEDWHMIRAMLHQQEDLLSWVWAQNNEHRLPVQRVLYLLLLWGTHDLRAGMILSQILMAIMALILAQAAASSRRDRIRATDALFPLAVLHLGHYQNLIWGWQIQFVWSVFLIGCLLALVVRAPGPISSRAGRWAAILLFLIPLSGANGIVVGLAMAGWLMAQALAHLAPAEAAQRWFCVSPGQQLRSRGSWLLLGSAGAVISTFLYYAGYESTVWKPWVTSPEQFLIAVRTYFALALGPGALFHETPAFLVVATYLVSGGIAALYVSLFGAPSERFRAVGLALFISSGVALGLVIAFARGGDTIRLQDRYALFAVLPLLAAAIALRLYAPRPASSWAMGVLGVAFLLLMPLNVRAGFIFRDWYVQGMEAVEADIATGATVEELADRHYFFLLHWNCDQLRDAIQRLRDAGVGPFADVP